MAHDVFISYSTKDKPIADGICANIESAGIRCWIAPRDIAPGEDWPTAITTAIKQSRAMVLVFSASSNSSEDVGRELMLAASSKLVIIPFKIDDVEPEPGKQYYLARTHWLDAINPPTREQIQTLIKTVKAFIPEVVIVDPPPGPIHVPPGPDPQPPSGKRPPGRRRLWIAASILVILGLAALAGFLIFQWSPWTAWLGRATAVSTTTSGQGGVLVSLTEPSAILRSGPGEDYSDAGVVTGRVTIVGQAALCSWFKVVSSTGTSTGWLPAEDVAFDGTCSAVPMVVVPSTPTARVAAAAPSRLGNLIAQELFSSNVRDWAAWNGVTDGCSTSSLGMRSGGLDWDLDAADTNDCIYYVAPSLAAVSDFDLSVDLLRASGSGYASGGLAFRIQSDGEFLAFLVDDGKQTFAVSWYLGSAWENPVRWTSHEGIRSGEVNRLTVSARGSTLTFLINDVVVATMEDTSAASGSVGVAISALRGGSLSATFDNFTLYTR